MKHYTEICEPYEYEKENASGGIEIIKKLSDCINTDRSLLKLVRIFVKDGGATATAVEDVVDEDEDNDDDEIVASESEDNACDNLNSELHIQQQQTALFLTSKKNKKQ